MNATADSTDVPFNFPVSVCAIRSPSTWLPPPSADRLEKSAAG